MRAAVVGLVLALVALSCNAESLNMRPIIGIMSQVVDWQTNQGTQYIAASYVKFIESAGARVVPIRYTDSPSDITQLLRNLNGVLFPGGGADITESTYYRALETVWKFALQANQAGDYFPLWGTCLGFQELHVLAAGGNSSILSPFDAENYSVPLTFTMTPSNTKLFASAPSFVVDILRTQAVTMNNHHFGVSPHTYSTQRDLNSFFDVISLNKDKQGKVFVSTVQAKEFPIYGVQWHPEKPIFEWNPTEAMNHTTDSIKANQYTADFFVSEARKSMHRFPSLEEENKALIYNYEPIYTWPEVHDFEQCYFFNA